MWWRWLANTNVGGDTAKAYPPKGDTGLRGLHQQVCENKGSAHHKLSVLYYLLLDHDDVRGARSNLADALAEESALPQKYQILMRGLWHMDRMEFKVRLSPPSLSFSLTARIFFNVTDTNLAVPSSPSSTSRILRSRLSSPTRSPSSSSATRRATTTACHSPTTTRRAPSSAPRRPSSCSSARSPAPA